MKAARLFATGLDDGLVPRTGAIRAELFGSLGAPATGLGHGSDKAVLLGVEDEDPETVGTASVETRVRDPRNRSPVPARPPRDGVPRERTPGLHRRRTLSFHPDGIRFQALDRTGAELRTRTHCSVGGGFVLDESAAPT